LSSAWWRWAFLSTGIAYVLNYHLIQDEGPTAASMTNYLAPVVAVLLGVAFVEERLSAERRS
jgi:drug/metabolite transporter (DMT)-like permease